MSNKEQERFDNAGYNKLFNEYNSAAKALWERKRHSSLERAGHSVKWEDQGNALTLQYLRDAKAAVLGFNAKQSPASDELIDQAKTILETIKSNYDSATDICTSGAEEIADVLEILAALRGNKEKGS
ncbi:MAG: hypothetical protein COA78_07090 [Blastopirellula sp.]|nr:MAG: hypothetical protein COA78_07090 [Blastopirellula sp.]